MPPKPLLFLSPLHRATRQIGIHLGEALTGLDVQGTEAHLLSFLNSYAPVPVSEISRVFGTRKSTLTSILNRLEERGLTVREPHPDDRRSLLVKITRRGRSVAKRVQRPVDELERQVRSRITAEELRGFQRVIEEIGNVTQVSLRSQPKEKP
ncbi:MAG: hypothetical protein DHS20C21_10970 [Gemmatimonadota bacterium]|nr:MAG: hypothetical protein DHS20C21_10970 [Gemmatimonadota bacterium]